MICPVCGGRKAYQAPWRTEFRTITCDYCNGTGEVDEDFPMDDFSGVLDDGEQTSDDDEEKGNDEKGIVEMTVKGGKE